MKRSLFAFLAATLLLTNCGYEKIDGLEISHPTPIIESTVTSDPISITGSAYETPALDNPPMVITPMPELSIAGGEISPKMQTLSEQEIVMGTLDGEFDEQPRHKITVGTFSIDVYEVSNIFYAQCVDAGVCQPPLESGSASHASYFDNPEFADYPVIHITWYMAKDYCEWRGGRLPTEAEWERAGWSFEGFKYGWGDYLDCGYLNYRLCNKGDTTPVDKYQRGGYDRIYGLPGNVWEWTSSVYMDYPYFIDDGREDPQSNETRVLRGGSYNELPNNVTITTRKAANPFEHFADVGFRCAKDIVP